MLTRRSAIQSVLGLLGFSPVAQANQANTPESLTLVRGDGFERYALQGGIHVLHCLTGPAAEFDGDKKWWVNGLLHRIGGPAVELNNGDKEYWVDGIRHREDGPAIDFKFYKVWFVNGKKHRIDGPALIRTNFDNCSEEWFIEGKHHRLDGPAVNRSLYKKWYRNGELWRENGPAIEYNEKYFGDKATHYFHNGKLIPHQPDCD